MVTAQDPSVTYTANKSAMALQHRGVKLCPLKASSYVSPGPMEHVLNGLFLAGSFAINPK